MAKIHGLHFVAGKLFCAVHYLTPSGNNSAAVSWKNALLAHKANETAQAPNPIPASVMSEGSGPGQITAAELAQIVAGDVIELTYTLDIAGLDGDSTKMLAEINAAITADKAQLAERLKWWGRSEGTVN